MAIQALGGLTSDASANLAATLVNQEDFIRILLTQLNFQDPLKPVDNQEFVAQLAQFTSLEQTRQLNDRVDILLAMQSANQSVGLIGKEVQVGEQSGEVTSIRFEGGEPRLTVLIRLPGLPPQALETTLGRITLVRDVQP